jgi:uncharacterized membrane protein YeiB
MRQINASPAGLPAAPLYWKPPRVAGYDLARALALLGMMFVNCKYLLEANEHGIIWLLWLSNWLDGRPAVIFVILAGIGISLLKNSSQESARINLFAKPYSTILKRATFLFLLGLLFSRIWYADILHFYGFYFAVSILLVNLSNRILFSLAGIALICTLFFAIYYNFVEFPKIDSVWDPDYWTQKGFLEDLFANGCYPVFPWIVYFMFGIWLGRLNLSDCRMQKKILTLSALAIVFSELFAWLVKTSLNTESILDSLPLLIFFNDTSPFSSSILSVFSAGGTALLIILSSIKLANKAGSARWLRPFLAAAQMSLTLYILHIGIIQLALIISHRVDKETPLEFAWIWATILCLLALAFAHSWVRHFGRGPLEKILRWVSK